MFTNLLLAGSIGDQLNAAFYNLDMAVFHFFGGLQGGFLTTLAKIFTAMGSTKYVALFALMGLVMCFFKRTRKVGFAIVFAVIIGTLITNIIVKPAVLRIRPYNTLQGDAQYWAWYIGAGQLCESDYSFPSGHTTGAFELATVLFLCHFTEKKKGVAWIFPVVAILTGASRIYLMVHY
ncbi:MAG: phosphatase PAP2 family protein, partial [Lachnospiraceae bacterium]|nr:phosphatase PAP2 family protein [Lachnospiraceae bacterium]